MATNPLKKQLILPGNLDRSTIRDLNGRCWNLTGVQSSTEINPDEPQSVVPETFAASAAFACCDDCDEGEIDIFVVDNPPPVIDDPEFSDPDESDPGGGDGGDDGGDDGGPDDDDDDDDDCGIECYEYTICDDFCGDSPICVDKDALEFDEFGNPPESIRHNDRCYETPVLVQEPSNVFAIDSQHENCTDCSEVPDEPTVGEPPEGDCNTYAGCSGPLRWFSVSFVPTGEGANDPEATCCTTGAFSGSWLYRVGDGNSGRFDSSFTVPVNNCSEVQARLRGRMTGDGYIRFSLVTVEGEVPFEGNYLDDECLSCGCSWQNVNFNTTRDNRQIAEAVSLGNCSDCGIEYDVYITNASVDVPKTITINAAGFGGQWSGMNGGWTVHSGIYNDPTADPSVVGGWAQYNWAYAEEYENCMCACNRVRWGMEVGRNCFSNTAEWIAGTEPLTHWRNVAIATGNIAVLGGIEHSDYNTACPGASIENPNCNTYPPGGDSTAYDWWSGQTVTDYNQYINDGFLDHPEVEECDIPTFSFPVNTGFGSPGQCAGTMQITSVTYQDMAEQF